MTLSKAFAEALGRSIGRYLTLDRLRDALQSQRSFQLTNSQVWLDFTNDLYAEFQNLLAHEFVRGSNSGLRAVHKQAGFSVTNPRAIAYATQYAAELVLDLSALSQAAVRGIIARVMGGELSVDSAARLIRASVGLTPQQTRALERFRVSLQGKYEPAYIDQQTETYGRRLLAHRSTTIARTETIRAQTEGRNAAWLEARDEGLLGPGVMKRWITADDELVCELCQPLDGQLAPLDGDWGGYTPPRHPACRCSDVLAFPDDTGNIEQRDPRPVPESVARSRRTLRPRLKRA